MTTEPNQPAFERRHPNAVPARCDLCPSEAKWARGGSRYCDEHAAAEEPSQLDRIEARLDRILELLDERKARPAQGHIVNSPKFQAALEEFRQQVTDEETGVISQEEAQRRYGDKTWNNPI